MPTRKALRGGGGGGGVRGRCQRRRRGRADTTGDSRRVPSCFAISQEAEELGVPSPPSGSGGGGARPPGGQGFEQPSSGAKRRRRRRAPARPPSARSTASMALRARSAWPPPGLSLLSLLSPLCWATPGAGTGTVGVLAPAQVRGFLGDTATLPCHLQPPPEQDALVTLVTWLRREPAGGARSVAVFHPTQGPSFPEPGRLEFVAARPGEKLRDASLAVRDLRAEDEANYTCQFAMFPEGSRSASTRLRVLAQPQNEAESLEVPLSRWLSPEPVPVARCISKGGRPPARISWPSPLNEKANESQVPGPLPGTTTVISLLTLTSSSQEDGKNVTCQVEHESFEEPVQLPVKLTVLHPPEVSISGYDDDWYLGRSEATLSCDVRSNPEPTGYDWSTTRGPLPPSAVAQGSRLLIHTVDDLINTTFICRVTNTLGTSQAELTVLGRAGPSGEPSAASWSPTTIAILTVVIVAGVALLAFLIYFLRSRNSRQASYKPSANGTVSYSAVNCGASSPQETPTEGTR
ncbi:poliovirus receptor homolog isoform X1 [Equus quagga]|uniref:poliovirus receptor homolog isoform X1 n=1 Tax=Equus quagga TaxID=89248 RepID=UPI001EE21A7E|nr:poliovirus receptor homolog isoform X1 [Equus quagga]